MVDLQLVIFDCDGVLVDSEVISNGVLARSLTAQGLSTTLAEARRDYQGLLLTEVVAQAQAKLRRALPKDWLAQYERERASAFRRALEPVQGAAEAVKFISDAGVAVCVASQGKLEKTRLSLELTGLDRLFPTHALFSAESVARAKPHPDLFLHAASTMRAEPARCVVVEDTPSGVTAALAAGMRAFGYIADSDEAALRAAGAERLGALNELPALLGLGSWTDEPVQIMPYDPSWPARFEEEHAALAAAIGGWAVGGIHHVGSTSVPGLESKPVIDILVGVRSLEESRACLDRLAGLGYLYAAYRQEEMHWFCKPNPSRRTHHLHLVPAKSSRFHDELAFRDFLRNHRDVAREYGALKRRLAKNFEHDREAYTDAKTEFILATVRLARDRSGQDS